MTSFDQQDLTGATFDRVDLSDATFRHVDLSRARLRGVDLTGVRVSEADLHDVTIDGELRGVVVNDVLIDAYVDGELDRRQPGRALMRPTDADGFRRAWAELERRWAETVAWAQTFTPEQLHASVAGEWSFVQTLRHLLYATDVWVSRALLGDPQPWHALDLPFDGMTPDPEVPWDREARPPLAEVLALRADRQATVRRYLAGLTDEHLDTTTTPVDGPGWPPAYTYPVREVLLTIFNEEWEHRRYAERDLRTLDPDRGGPPAAPASASPPWEPPLAGGPDEQLLAALDRLRWTFRWKADGLDAGGLAARIGASTLTLGGLLKHLAGVEATIFTAKAFGEDPGEPWRSVDWEAQPDWEFESAADDLPEQLYATYDAAVATARARIDRALAEGGLDQRVAASDEQGNPANLRRLVADLVEEYGRHTGHADLLREAVDGRVGEDPPDDWRPTGG